MCERSRSNHSLITTLLSEPGINNIWVASDMAQLKAGRTIKKIHGNFSLNAPHAFSIKKASVSVLDLRGLIHCIIS